MSQSPEGPSTDDALEDARQSVAEVIAALSEAEMQPTGVAYVDTFSSEEVDFDSAAWRRCVQSVEGWLNLDAKLDRTSPTQFLASLSAGLGVPFAGESDSPTIELLQGLYSHASAAVSAQALFLDETQTENFTQQGATRRWRERLQDSAETENEQTFEPVQASADTWKIKEFVDLAKDGDINLAPSYQRSDVWPLPARQILIESILRGIPLPSIILLNDPDVGSAYDVVDGRQRLTSILRFIGAHPEALKKVDEVEAAHPGSDLRHLFETDYPTFKKAWKSYEGALSAKQEEQLFFPFKLRGGGPKPAVAQGLSATWGGKYYSQIYGDKVQTAKSEESIRKIFEGTSNYRVPIIVYEKTNAKQIHEVFNLYNRQGVHLNAEEMRNAIYHELELTRAVLVASGDYRARPDQKSIAKSLDGISDHVVLLQEALEQYKVSIARYRRSKIVSWVLSTVLHQPEALDQAYGPRYASTAKHIDAWMEAVQVDPASALRSPEVVADLFATFAKASEVHAQVEDEVWTTKFREGVKWRDLQLVGSLAGVLAAGTVLGDELGTRMGEHADELSDATLSWKRPTNAQSRSQWQFVATVARGTLTHLGLTPEEAHQGMLDRFGTSGLQALFSLVEDETAKASS